MNKKIIFAFGLLAIVSLAYAQSGEGLRLTPGGISGVASSQEQSPSADSAQAQPSVVYPVPPRPSLDNIFVGFVQFNNLVVESISNKIPECPGNALQTPCTYSAEIIANYGYPVPMMDKMRGSMTPGGVTPEPVSSASAPQLKCYSFQSRDSAAGVSIDCPGRPSTAPSATPTTPPATAAPNSMPYPMPKYPPQYSYRIKISSDTRLSLRDRTPATLADFSAGDQINVFGFYNSDGSIQAFIVRDLSKPIERRFIQLENVELVSVSQTSAPADLVVVQRQIYPCYDYGFEGNIKRPFPCPMGVRFTQNLQTPISLIPIWDSLRKYVVKVDSQTMLLDRTKNRIGLSGLKIGDKLNIYGSVTGDGGTIDADIVRDLTQPAEARNLNGTITQVNADGSFVLQTESGETFTVPNPIQVGATIKLKGLVDELQKLVTQISEMTIRSNSLLPPPICNLVDCAAPPPGCNYQGGTTCSCGKLVCETPLPPLPRVVP